MDPELTLGLPPAITASTGLDALTQLIEPYVCSRANPMVDALCVEGIRRAARSLRVVFEDGRNASAREDMALASLYGGLALANAGLGAVHGFAGPIGGMFPAPHGAVCAALLPHVMETNLRALQQREPTSDSLERYKGIAQNPDRQAKCERAGMASSGCGGLVSGFENPAAARLRNHDLEISAEIIERAGKASSMKANPIALTDEELADDA